MKHLGTKTIKTDRLILRKIELKDAQEFTALLNDEMVQKYLSGIPSGYTEEMAVDYIGGKLASKYQKPDFYDWGIEEKETHNFIGRITVYRSNDDYRMADLIWYIMPTVRGKGYIVEAGKAVVEFLQNIGYERIEAFADAENSASLKVMEKLGMQYEGTLRKYDCRRDDSLYDVKMYSIIKE